MSEPISTSIVKAFETVLAGILKADGYNTDLGLSVHRGFFAHAINARGAVYPLVAVQPETEIIKEAREGKNKIESSIRFVVATDDMEYPADICRACVADIRRAFALKIANELKSLGVNLTPELGTAEFALSADSPLTLVALPVSFLFVENYEA
jgi:hypothetical protein